MNYLQEWFKDGSFLFCSEKELPNAYIHKETGEVSYGLFIKDFSKYESLKIELVEIGEIKNFNV